MATQTLTQNAQSTLHIFNDAKPALSYEQLGQWETSTRVLASLVNDHMLTVSPCKCPDSNVQQLGVILQPKMGTAESKKTRGVWIGVTDAGARLTKPAANATAVWPGDFAAPVFTVTDLGEKQTYSLEYHPASLVGHFRGLLMEESVPDSLFDQVRAELSSSAANQRYWYEWMAKRPWPTLESRAIDWEQTLYTGHPLHPMHRSLFAQEATKQIEPKDIGSLMDAHISFISVPGSDVRINGTYRKKLQPLLEQFGLDAFQAGQVIIPCLTIQIPAISEHFPRAKVLIKDAVIARTQSSLRTVSVPNFAHDLKFALTCKIGSALRTITPWTTCAATEVSAVLKETLPQNVWLLEDVAAISGSQTDFNEAKHISCVIRENLEDRAAAQNEVPIVCGAFAEIPPGEQECCAVSLFGLNTEEKKMSWLSDYVHLMHDALLPSVITHGIAFEAHAQNVLVRVDKTTKAMKGCAVRDLGSIKIHMSTLAQSGYELFSAIEGSFVTSAEEVPMWRIIHFCLYENHLNVLIYRLGVDRPKAWAMVRELLNKFFDDFAAKNGGALPENGERFRKFLFEPVIEMKAFMVMKFASKHRDYEYVTSPNVLLS